MTRLNVINWIENEPEYIGPNDEMKLYFDALVHAAHTARYGDEADRKLLANMAFKQQAESILWIYQSGEDYEEYGLPEPLNADHFRYKYGSPEALEFAEWAMNNRDPDWETKLEQRYLEERLSRLKNGI
jgi:hypothetical protein